MNTEPEIEGEDDGTPLQIPLNRLSEYSPFNQTIWPISSGITIAEVVAARLAKRYQAAPTQDIEVYKTRQYHIERVAYLADHPTEDPISLDVGVPSLGCYVAMPVQDGFHRLAAAFVRGEHTIAAHVSGSHDYMHHLFGVTYNRTAL